MRLSSNNKDSVAVSLCPGSCLQDPSLPASSLCPRCSRQMEWVGSQFKSGSQARRSAGECTRLRVSVRVHAHAPFG